MQCQQGPYQLGHTSPQHHKLLGFSENVVHWLWIQQWLTSFCPMLIPERGAKLHCREDRAKGAKVPVDLKSPMSRIFIANWTQTGYLSWSPFINHAFPANGFVKKSPNHQKSSLDLQKSQPWAGTQVSLILQLGPRLFSCLLGMPATPDRICVAGKYHEPPFNCLYWEPRCSPKCHL